MARDAVIEETRRARNRLAKTHGYDIGKIASALRRAEAESGRKPVMLPGKKLPPRRTKVG